MYPGQLVLIKLCCPACGEPQPYEQTAGSAFFAVDCHNKSCQTFGSEIWIEQRTHTVVEVNRRYFKDHDGQSWRHVWEKVSDSEVV